MSVAATKQHKLLMKDGYVAVKRETTLHCQLVVIRPIVQQSFGKNKQEKMDWAECWDLTILAPAYPIQ